MKYQAIRGMKDILPGEVERWQAIEHVAREFFGRFGYQELRLPILEKTDLFVRSIGQTTDVVEKEMYTFTDLSGESLTMRPEATAQVCRAFVEHKLYAQPGGWKVYTIGPMFRHERPQKGRFRQFHQIDCEVLGLEFPQVDSALIAMLVGFLKSCQVGQVKVRLNSLGCPRCRPAFQEKLIAFLQDRGSELCEDCQRRFRVNPLRALDCKQASCQRLVADAPAASDHLCDDCKAHFRIVCGELKMYGVEYFLDKSLVRGLDYYVRTTFEVVSDKLGGQDSVAGGGRYDGLIAALGGPDLPGTGFAIGLERLLLLAKLEAGDGELRPDLFIAAIGDEPRQVAAALAHRLRVGDELDSQKKGFKVLLDFVPRSLKAQMRQANKVGAKYTLILGDHELEKKEAPLRKMETGQQHFVPTKPVKDSADKIIKESADKIIEEMSKDDWGIGKEADSDE